MLNPNSFFQTMPVGQTAGSGTLSGLGLQRTLQPGMSGNVPSLAVNNQFDALDSANLDNIFSKAPTGAPASFIQPIALPVVSQPVPAPAPVIQPATHQAAGNKSVQTILALLLTLLSAAAKGKTGKSGEQPFKGTLSEKGDTDKNQKTERKGAQEASDSSPPKGKGNTGIADGKGWAKNVNVFASSNAQEESIGVYSNDQLVGGYTAELGRQMDEGKTLKQAHDDVKLDTQTPMRNHANDNSLVPGKGGKAVVVTGDGINKKEADQFAEKLRKNYGMDVEVIGDASPKQLKASIEKMGKEGGEQCMVAVLAHGAKDGSGQNKGNMALGKGDGDPWLSEDLLQSMVNDNLANSFDNVNVVVSSCYGGNYVE